MALSDQDKADLEVFRRMYKANKNPIAGFEFGRALQRFTTGTVKSSAEKILRRLESNHMVVEVSGGVGLQRWKPK